MEGKDVGSGCIDEVLCEGVTVLPVRQRVSWVLACEGGHEIWRPAM